MKKLLICIILVFITLSSFSQTVIKNRIDCKRIHATKRLTWYTDSLNHVNDSIYFTQEYDYVTSLSGPFYIENIYHYDGKNIYYHSDLMNVQFLKIRNSNLKDELSHYYLPKLSKDELKRQIQLYDEAVIAYAKLRNEQCIKSIKYENYKNSNRYRDSIRLVQDSIIYHKERDSYIKSHQPRSFKSTKYNRFNKDCFYDKQDFIDKDEFVHILGYENDTLQYTKTKKYRTFGEKRFYTIFTTVINLKDITDKELRNHLDYFKDSLDLIRSERIKNFRDSWYYLDAIYDSYTESMTKYGYFDNVGFELNSVGGINPYFTFTNTNDKVVKYVEVFFNVYNAVNDKCKDKYSNSYTFTLKGVGPIKKFQKAVFDWTNNPATHYTSYDASYIKISKVRITYMDNSIVSFSGKEIFVNEQ